MDIYSYFTGQYHYGDLPVQLCQEKRQSLSLVALDQIEQAIQLNATSLLQCVLSPAERDYFQRFKYMKRKKEWLGGRIAAKAAMLTFSRASENQKLSSITILPNKHGRPIAEKLPACLSAQGSELVISLSHSDCFAVGLARLTRNEASCGVDLQKVSTKLAGLTSHFASEGELQLLSKQADCDEDIRLTMLWTAKEALKKALLHDQSVIFSATELQEIALVSDSIRRFTCTVQGQCHSVLVHTLSPYILSITEEKTGEHDHA